MYVGRLKTLNVQDICYSKIKYKRKSQQSQKITTSHHENIPK